MRASGGAFGQAGGQEVARMRMKPRDLSRREFIGHNLGGAGLLLLSGAGLRTLQASAAAKTNPYAYDVSKFERTDPALVRYEEKTRFACGKPEPRRLCVGPADRICVAAKAGIAIFDSEGGFHREIGTSAPARCVAVDADGTVYAGLRDRVQVFAPDGRSLAAWEAPLKKAWFTGLAVGANDVYAADASNRLVLRFDKSGKFLGRIGEKNKDRGIPGLIVPSPYLDVKIGRDGLLRINNPGRHRVEAYTPEGDLEQWWGKASAAIEGFCGCCNPVGLALLPDGRVVTCEKGMPRCKVYSATGEFECVVSGPERFPENGKAGSGRDRSDGSLGGLDAAVDSRGRIFLLDVVTGGIHVMSRKA
jgi:hypothetical protein